MTDSDIVERLFPYDGPHSIDTIHNAAAALPDLVRYLNNATGFGGKRLQHAQDVYRIVGNLQHMAGLLPQLLEQMRKFLDWQATDGLLYADSNPDDPELAKQIAIQLSTTLMLVTDAAHALAARLGLAHNFSSHLGNIESDGDTR